MLTCCLYRHKAAGDAALCLYKLRLLKSQILLHLNELLGAKDWYLVEIECSLLSRISASPVEFLIEPEAEPGFELLQRQLEVLEVVVLPDGLVGH